MYIDHFGFTGQPFQLTPDARFWFESRTHRKAMAYLGYGLAQGEGFVVVTGEIGAGKSTLVAHLMATIDRARLNAISLVSTQVEGDDMLRLATQGLGIATSGVAKATLLDAVEQKLEEEMRAGKKSLLIVDEAQNLPVSALEELRMLSNFQVAGRALIQIVLLGQPEFRDKLASPGLEQLRQRVIASHHLDAMGPDEVEAYVRHRLALVGWQGRPDFSDQAFEAFHRWSQGIPRRLNQIANRVLLQAAIEDEPVIGADTVDAVASEIQADVPAPAAASQPPVEGVLPLRAVRSEATVIDAPISVADPSLARRVAAIEDRTSGEMLLARRIEALEARAEEQEKMLRRVLVLLVDWVENSSPGTAYRTHAA